MSREVGEKWDGWPPHSVSKYLFVQRKYFLIPFEGPNQDPLKVGCLRMFAEISLASLSISAVGSCCPYIVRMIQWIS